MNASDTIAERYRLERLLGTGGMSEVWLAEDTRLGRWVAVKLLSGAAESDLEREARVVARLHHPNIAAVYDTGRQNGQPYLVMEYVHGLSLRELLAERGGRMAEGEAVRYVAQVADALQYAHGQGVIHCDVKPENILVTEEGVTKTVDFGIAETLGRTLSPQAAREILGTIPYLAPEVIQGSPPDGRSDTYSLALTLYELVAGRLPFAGTNAAAVAGQRLSAAAPPLRTFAQAASSELEAVLARALALTPADRYPDARGFAAAIRASQERRPSTPASVTAPVVVHRSPPRVIPARPPIRHDTARVPIRRDPANRWPLVAVLIGVALALGGGAVVVFALLNGGSDGAPVTPTAVPTATVPAGRTPSPSAAATATPPAATATGVTTQAPTPVTSTATSSSSPSPTRTPTATATRTPTSTAPTATSTGFPTATPTLVVSPTATKTP